jgi:AcrR family transcriptional regulator
MARKYELQKRAERQMETRQRIVDAAIQLHRSLGPARTSLSDIARLAGVQRHTVYRHFPDDRSLNLACSGHFMDTNPPPDPESWRELTDVRARLRRGLTELYEFFERVSDMLVCVLRDAEVHPLTREMFELRGGAAFGRTRSVLAELLPTDERTLAALDLALDFRAWQSLVQRSGLSNATAAETMVVGICGHSEFSRSRAAPSRRA